MSSPVYFTDFRASPKKNMAGKLNDLLIQSGLPEVIRERDLVAVKLHFGELGNTAFVRPIFVRQIVKAVKALSASPFVTDTNTLYAGTRSDAPSHIDTAVANGFAYSVVDAPLIVADGLRGKSEVAVEVNLKRFKTV